MANLIDTSAGWHIYSYPSWKSHRVVSQKNGDQLPHRSENYPWNAVVGIGDTHKAAADFEDKWLAKALSADMYSGPSWEGGIKRKNLLHPSLRGSKTVCSPVAGTPATPTSSSPAPPTLSGLKRPRHPLDSRQSLPAESR